MRAEEIAGALGGLRVAYREQSKGKAGGGACLPLSAVEVLYWIAAGVRTMPELQKVMGAHPSLVSRAVGILRGRSRFRAGGWVGSPLGLVVGERNPHGRGLLLKLSADGRELVGGRPAPGSQRILDSLS
jgi:hypothetical protein